MSLTLKHHGIKGQKWGVRRFQNPDGSWTAAGAQRYGAGGSKVTESSKTFDGSNGYTGKATYTKISGKGSKKRDKQTEQELTIDKDYQAELEKEYGPLDEWDKMDYSKAEKFDQIGFEAMEHYHKSGKEAATKYIQEKLKGYTYEALIHDEEVNWSGQEEAERYVGFQLKIMGDQHVYHTAGDRDYSDDQYFSRRKSK